MLEKNDLIQLKVRTLERLQEVNVEDYTLDQTDIRLKDYVKSAISHPDDHNLYELLSILRFFRLLDAYIFKPTEVKKFIVFYENLKFSGLDHLKITQIYLDGFDMLFTDAGRED